MDVLLKNGKVVQFWPSSPRQITLAGKYVIFPGTERPLSLPGDRTLVEATVDPDPPFDPKTERLGDYAFTVSGLAVTAARPVEPRPAPVPPFFVAKMELWERATQTERRAITKFLQDKVADAADPLHEAALDFKGDWDAAITIEVSSAKWIGAVGFMLTKDLVSQATHDAMLLL